MTRLVFALLLLLPLAACGQPAPVDGRIAIEHPWTRATVGGSGNAAVYMTITSPVADRLLAASTPVARETDLMTMQGGTEAMAMAYVEAIEIAANQPVSLGPTGLHVWLAGLERPLAPGESFPLSLEFEHAGRQEVTVSVIEAAAPPMSGMKM